ncbi:MAG: triose-phosphate isomerase [Rhodothermales bacterium]|nr:triose-phosphate isomerase [Rhodothermales bacterium]
MLIAGNWKMNTDVGSAIELAREIAGDIGSPAPVKVAVCPPTVNVSEVARTVNETALLVGAQNMFYEESGAFTGETSPAMLSAVGCHYVILGHSERRQYFGETDDTVNRKVRKAVEHGLVPILCVGEHLAEREAGQEEDVVSRQVRKGLSGVLIGRPGDLVIAYEPVWAIGTGRTATPAQAQEMHSYIRGLLRDQFGEAAADAIEILYGGSMNPGNADELLSQKDVDGGLIGGASLNADSFVSIVESAKRLA